MTRRVLCSMLLVSLGLLALGCASRKDFSSLQVTPNAASLNHPGLTYQFHATAIYQQGQQSGISSDVTKQVTWTSSDPGVATVDSSGVATAVNAGTATITATFQVPAGPATANAELDVISGAGGATRTLTGITIIPAAGTQTVYAAGETAQFLAIGTYNASPTTQDITNTVTWQSADVDVATINLSGLATAVSCTSPQPPCLTNVTATSTLADGTSIVATSDLSVFPGGGSTNLPSLTVYPVGQGSGTIVSSPVGISCVSGAASGASCTADFPLNSAVTLRAAAAAGTTILGTSSNCVPNTAPTGATTFTCQVTMGGNQTVGVIFNK